MEIGSTKWKMGGEFGKWKDEMEIENWKLEIGNWKLEIGRMALVATVNKSRRITLGYTAIP